MEDGGRSSTVVVLHHRLPANLFGEPGPPGQEVINCPISSVAYWQRTRLLSDEDRVRFPAGGLAKVSFESTMV